MPFFENEYRSTLEANGVQELHYPEYPEPFVDGNTFMNATGLREPIEFQGGKVRAIAAEVTDHNMRYWMKLQLQCSDDQMAKFNFDTASCLPTASRRRAASGARLEAKH